MTLLLCKQQWTEDGFIYAAGAMQQVQTKTDRPIARRAAATGSCFSAAGRASAGRVSAASSGAGESVRGGAGSVYLKADSYVISGGSGTMEDPYVVLPKPEE